MPPDYILRGRSQFPRMPFSRWTANRALPFGRSPALGCWLPIFGVFAAICPHCHYTRVLSRPGNDYSHPLVVEALGGSSNLTFLQVVRGIVPNSQLAGYMHYLVQITKTKHTRMFPRVYRHKVYIRNLIRRPLLTPKIIKRHKQRVVEVLHPSIDLWDTLYREKNFVA